MARLSRSAAPWERRAAADRSHVGRTMCCVRCRRTARRSPLRSTRRSSGRRGDNAQSRRVAGAVRGGKEAVDCLHTRWRYRKL